MALESLLLACQSTSSKALVWDELAEAYIDIIWNLGDALLTERKVQFSTLGDYSLKVSVGINIENEMHKLCAHFRKLVEEWVFNIPESEKYYDKYVVCSKKYGSPCHRLTVWVSR